MRRSLRVLLVLFAVIAAAELLLQLAHLFAQPRARNNQSASSSSSSSSAAILCLGDSHTFGAGVKADEAYPARLQEKLRARGYAVNAINLGAPGYNTSELRRRLPDWIKTYSPSAVIILAGVNNGWNRADAAWSDQQDGLPVPLAARVKDFLVTRVRIVRGIVVLLHRLQWAGPAEENARNREGQAVIHSREDSKETKEAAYDRARRDLVALIALCRANHATPLLMTYVSDPQYTFETPNHLLRQVAASLKVPLADNDQALRPLLQKPDGALDPQARDRLFFPDMHPRPPAYDRIADNVLQALDQAGALAGPVRDNK